MSVGTQLQQARTEQKLTIAQVAAATRIQPWVLESLEADRLPEQMSRIYLRGFLASYARFLHLDPAPLLAALPSDQPLQEQKTELPAAPPKATRERQPMKPIKITIPWQHLARAGRIGAVAAAVALVIAVNPIRLVAQIPWQTITLPKFSLPSLPRIAKEPKPAVKKIASTAKRRLPAAVKPLAQLAERPAAKPSPEPVVAKAPIIEVKPVPAAEPPVLEPQVASIAPLQNTVHQPQLPSFETLATQPLEVLITASRTTWIRVRADGKLLAQERLKRGAKERWKAKNRLEVIVANPSQVELSLNGQSITSHAIAYQGKLLITHRGVSQLASPE